MIVLLLIFIMLILLFGAAAVKTGMTKAFFGILVILAIAGAIVALSGDIGKEEALPIFLGVSISFILIIALVCFVVLKILMKPAKSEETTTKNTKWKIVLLHILLWCGTAASLFFSINFFTKNYHYGYNSLMNGLIFFIPVVLLCPLFVMRLIKQPKFRIVGIACGIVIFAGYLFFISSDTYYYSDGFIQYRQVRTTEQIEALFADYSLSASVKVEDKYCNQVTIICSDLGSRSEDDLISIGNALQEYDSFDLDCSIFSGLDTYTFSTDFHDGFTISKNGEQIYPQEREKPTATTSNSKGEYWCMGKNDTCQNKTSAPHDFFCDECDPDGDNKEG